MSYHHFVSANLVKKTQEIAPVQNYRFYCHKDGFFADLLEVRFALDTILIEEYKRLQDPLIKSGYGLLISVDFHFSHPTEWCRKSLLCNNKENPDMVNKTIPEGPLHEQTRPSGHVFVTRDLTARSLPSLRRFIAMGVSKEMQAIRANNPPIPLRVNPRAVLVTQIVKKSYAQEHHPSALTALKEFEALIVKKRKQGNSLAGHYDANLELLKNLDTIMPLHLMRSPMDYVNAFDYVKIPILYNMELEELPS